MLFSRTSRGTNAEMLIEMENHAQDADRTCRHLLPGPIGCETGWALGRNRKATDLTLCRIGAHNHKELLASWRATQRRGSRLAALGYPSRAPCRNSAASCCCCFPPPCCNPAGKRTAGLAVMQSSSAMPAKPPLLCRHPGTVPLR